MSTPEVQEVYLLPETAIWSINYNSVIDEINPHLDFCRSEEVPSDLGAITEEVVDSLNNPPGPMDEQAAISESRDLLEDSAAAYVDDFRSSAASALRADYPDSAPDENFSLLETPNRYIKRNGLDGSMRPALRTARESAIQASRRRLSDKICKEIRIDQYDLDIDDAALIAGIDEYRQSAQEELTGCVEKIKKLLPIEDCRGLRTYDMASKINSLAEGEVLAYDTYTRHPAFILKAPSSKKEWVQLQNAMFELKKVLGSIESTISGSAKHAAAGCEQEILHGLDKRLDQDISNLTEEELQILAEELEAAYGQAAKNGSGYKAKVKDTPEAEEDSGSEASETRMQTIPEMIGPESEILGEIDNQFPWSNGENVQISSLRTSQVTVLFCEAMSPVAKKISGRLRGQPRSSREFDQHWKKIITVEAGNNAHEYGNIKKTTWAQSDKLAGHSVLQYGAIKPNAPRTYYIRTYAAKYPTIAELAIQKDIEPSTPLLILIAETDKANQLRTLGDFGISRVIAKAGGAGSI